MCLSRNVCSCFKSVHLVHLPHLPSMTSSGTKKIKIKIDQCCGICEFRRSWNSQEMIGSLPSRNFSMSTVILFSDKLYLFISLHNCYNHNLITCMNVLKMSALLFFYKLALYQVKCFVSWSI